MRSFQATVLLAVAWLSFALPIALLPRETDGATRVGRDSDIVAVPTGRSATSVEEAPAGRATRGSAPLASIASAPETYVLGLVGVECIRLLSTTFACPLEHRVAPYDATAPPVESITA